MDLVSYGIYLNNILTGAVLIFETTLSQVNLL